jgi:hypothetical protein
MRPLKILLFVVFFLILNQTKAQLNSTSEGPLQVVGSNKLSAKLNSGDIFEAVFHIRNNSTETQYIAQVAPDCVCTQFAFPEKGIEAGATDSITLFLQSKNVPPGPFFKRAFVDYTEGSFELQLEGDLTVIRPKYKQGEKPIIYQPTQIRKVNQ